MTAPTQHRRFRSLLLNLLLLGATTVVALALAEGALRFSRRTTPSEEVGGRKLEPDTLYGWVKKKDYVGRRTSTEFDVEERFNSRRIRGPEYPLAKPEGEYRILLLGDSFAEGYTVEFEQVLSEVMKRRLNERTDFPVQVINAGTAGWSTDQELLWLQQEGLAYEPDLVVLLFYINDIVSNASNRYWRGYKPYYAAVDGEAGPTLELRGVPVPGADPPEEGPEAGDPTAAPAPPPSTTGLRGWLLAHSMLYRDMSRLVKTSEPLFRVARALRLTKESEPLRLAPPGEWAPWRNEPEPRMERAWRMSRLLIEGVQEEARKGGAEFLFVHAPSREAIHAWSWENAQAMFHFDPEEWTPGAEEDVLRTICQEDGMPCLFLREPFELAMAEGGAAQGQDLYWRWDRHWNVLGNRVAGESIADRIFETILTHGSPTAEPARAAALTAMPLTPAAPR